MLLFYCILEYLKLGWGGKSVPIMAINVQADTKELNQSSLEDVVNPSGHRPPQVKICQSLKKK